MSSYRTVRVGVHARNDFRFTKQDYEIVQEAKIETIKMMSFTDISVFSELRKINPNIEFIVRLFDKIDPNSPISPRDFANKFIPRLEELRPFVVKFEIHNEPNHLTRIEGWGQTDDDARRFRDWFIEVYSRLKSACPWASLGFPGLAIPHRDLEWLEICRPAIEKADWLGCHCYWQTPPDQPQNHLSDMWGLRFKTYHTKFPNKVIEITEFGNSSGDNPSIPYRPEDMAKQYVEYFQELFKYHYINSACAFIASSHDRTWEDRKFVWVKSSGEKLPVIKAVGTMPRPSLRPVVLLPEYGVEFVSYAILEEPKAGQKGKANFVLRNTGRKKWLAAGPNMMRLGYHWYTSDNQVVPAAEDIRASLPRDISTGEEVQLKNVEFAAPLKPGKYTLQWNMVEEGVAWFSDKGAKALTIDMTVGEAPPPTELYFPETKRTVKGAFLEFFRKYGLDICGYPITEQFIENGLPTQYFQRVILEEYEPDKIRLRLAGSEFYAARESLVGLNQQFGTLQSQVSQLQNTTQSLQSELIEWKNKATEQQEEATRWQATATELQGKVGELQNTAQSLQSSLAEWQSKAGELEAQVKHWQAEAFRQQGMVTNLMEQVEELQEKLKAMPAPAPTPAPKPVVPTPKITDITDSLPRHPSQQYSARALESIKYLVIHHAAVPPTVGAERIARYHVENQGWPGIGYHFFIAADGLIYQTNKLETISYHAQDVNPTGVGICLAGNFTSEIPTVAQLDGTAELCAYLLDHLKLNLEAVKGHKDFVQTQCPGQQWDSGQVWRNILLERIKEIQAEAQVAPAARPKGIGHYILFWQYPDSWAKADWLNAINYIGRFRTTCGFSVDDAMTAEFVTIIGGPLGVPAEVEELLKSAGCKVERIAGKDESDTKRILDEMAERGQRFLTFPGG